MLDMLLRYKNEQNWSKKEDNILLWSNIIMVQLHFGPKDVNVLVLV
jgi:hypothetical protein